MDSKKTQKLSKAAVATVLAASGVVVAMPQPANAYMFSDLNPTADYYQPIIELYNRNIIGSERSNKFRPNEAITRGDAAKMLALSIGLDTRNVTNPKFADVPTSSEYYPYIAALANAGIINGYQDKTFRAKENITRSQMAKILTLGYKFGVTQKLSNDFKDVSSKTSNAYYIQTLLNLKVTKGRTAVTYEPHSLVTRGQMATFIWRAMNADAGKPVYTIGDITSNKVYINGVAYSISAELRPIFNPSNRSILKGAEVEGRFSGMTLMSLTKLTINANGTATGLLALDADESTFDGNLVINGNYLRIKNWKLTGDVTIAEKQRRSLANHVEFNAFKNTRIASLSGVGFIDWEEQTKEQEPTYLNPGTNQNLIDKPDEDDEGKRKKYELRMPKIEKYIDFESTSIENLYIEHNNAYVSADSDIERLTIARDVANVELYADSQAMYLDTDVNLTIYGEHDAEYVYKNSYKSLSLWTDSFYDYMYVTNGSGWIDLGEFAYIDEVILPPKKSPNDIFDDYENDNGNIGYIEDEEGNEVDRDPVENQIIPDDRPPEITQLVVEPGGSSAKVTVTADEDGAYYYMVLPADERPPSISEIKTNAKPPYGSGTLLMDEPATFVVNDLEQETEYVIYIIAIDDEENVSDRSEEAFVTKDGSPPSISINGAQGVYGGKRVQFNLNVNEGGTYYYWIRKETSAAAPTAEDIIAMHTGKETVDRSGNYTVMSNIFETNLPIEPNSRYEIFAAMEDKSGNISTVTKGFVTSTELDNESPYIINKNLEYEGLPSNYFYVYFNEELDKAVAEDINNYVLSGTGIVNVTGQTEIQPSEAVYTKEGTGSKVRLTIPSITGFVNGDLLRVTVLPTLVDRAENPFESIDNPGKNNVVDNYADYNHSDIVPPILNILNVNTNNDQTKADVLYNTSKAGTVYYMIMPSDVDLTNIKPRDFVDEFDGEKTGKFQNGNKNIYVGTPNKRPALLGDQEIDVDIPPDLDPFTSYSLYMVVRDRSGGLSQIKSSHIKDDSKPPLVSDLSISGGEGNVSNDTAAEIKIATDEGGLVHYWTIPKYVRDENSGEFVSNPVLATLTVPTSTSSAAEYARFANAVKENRQGSMSITKGVNNIPISGLIPHQEYFVYVAVEDTFGNVTARFMGNPGGTTINDAEPNGDVMELEYYSDVTKPQIDDVIKRSLDEKEFTITFNESILRREQDNESILNQSNWTQFIEIYNETGTQNITNEYDFVSYTPGTTAGVLDTTKNSQLVIKIKSNTAADADRTINVKMKKNAAGDSTVAYDFIDQNAFDLEDFGKYVYPVQRTVLLRDAYLVNPTGSQVLVSKTMKLVTEYDVDVTNDQKYYYAVVPSIRPATKPDPKAVITAVETGAAPTGSTFIIFGSGTLPNSSATSQELQLVTGDINPQDTFQQSQKIFVFTLDKYGNVVWATGPNGDYIEVQ